MQSEQYNLPEAKRSRAAYAMECTFEYFVTLLVSDAYLSSLLDYMGISDAVIGIISSLISLAFLFQLFSLFAVKRIKRVKRASILFHFGSQIFFMSLYLIPFIPMSQSMRTVTVVGTVLAAYFGNYLVTSIIFKWGMSYVDPHKRADYSSTKEMISLISGIVFTLAIGFAVDEFSKSGNVSGGFVFIAGAVLLSSLLDLACLLIMKEPAADTEETKNESVASVVKELFSNKSFICILITGILYFSAEYLTNSFMGIYKVSQSDLGFSVGEVQVINIVGCLFRFAISKPLGKFSDKTSHATGFLVGAVILCFCFFLNIFTTPSSRWMVYVYTLLFNGARAATNQNFLNMPFDYIKSEHFVHASSIKAAIAGISGFLATLVGARLLSSVQKAGNSFLGIEMHGQQLLSAISLVISLVLVFFVFFVLRKQKRISEED